MLPIAFPSFFRRHSGVVLGGALLALLAGCHHDKKADPEPAVVINSVQLELQHNGPGDATPLRLNTAYTTAQGQAYQLDQLAYYVSNIKLLRADGSAWKQRHSYHLVRVAGAPAANPVIVLDSVPAGTYTSIEFGIGVDSATNHHGDQQYPLSANEGMLWTWATGYKFWVMEGDYLPVGNPSAGLTYHIGFDPQYRTVRLPLPTAATVSSGVVPQIQVYVDVNHFFTGLDLSDSAQRFVMGGVATAALIADNIAAMFRVERVSNK